MIVLYLETVLPTLCAFSSPLANKENDGSGHSLFALLFHVPLVSMGLIKGFLTSSEWIQSMRDQAIYSPSSLSGGWWLHPPLLNLLIRTSGS